MKDLRQILMSRIENLINDRDKSLQKFQEDFCYQFSWSGEDTFKTCFEIQELSKIVADMEDIGEQNSAKRWVKYYRDYCSRPYLVRENSSGSLHREASTYIFQVMLDICNYLESMIDNK
jgi:hypothetical protein